MSFWKTPSSGLALALLHQVSVILPLAVLPALGEPELPHAARTSAAAAATVTAAYFRVFRVLRMFSSSPDGRVVRFITDVGPAATAGQKPVPGIFEIFGNISMCRHRRNPQLPGQPLIQTRDRNLP